MNPVVHFEVPFDDSERAKTFYHTVFGWQMMDIPEMNYIIARSAETDEQHMLKESGRINGGMLQRNDAVKSPIIVLDCKDLDAKLEEVVAAGGEVIVPKMTVGEMGWCAYVHDTEKNLIGVWQGSEKHEAKKDT